MLANEKNLKPVRSKSEARERGGKGGKASGEARRKRKALKENMEMLLSLAPDKRTITKLKAQGIEEKEVNNTLALTFALMNKAMQGDVKAFQEIRNLVGETQEVVQTNEAETDGLSKALLELAEELDGD